MIKETTPRTGMASFKLHDNEETVFYYRHITCLYINCLQ
jgi:hypothetical protein